MVTEWIATLGSMATVFGLGVVYFIAAIPAGVALQLHPAVAAFCAWAGYTAIAAAMLAIGEPARRWMGRKFNLSPHPDPDKLFWRVWNRFGLPGLALLAPVTCGPYFAALLAIALGEKPTRLLLWIAGGALPWCILFAILAGMGVTLFGGG